MSAWKSRWSCVRLVKSAAAKCVPSTRWSASACEETSIAQARSPPSSIARKAAWRSIASGVVWITGALAPADHRLDGPEQPAALAGGLEQRREQEDRRRLAVGAGDPDDAERRARVAVEADRERRHRRAHGGDHELGYAEAERALDDERDGAGGDRLGRRGRGRRSARRGRRRTASRAATARLS